MTCWLLETPLGEVRVSISAPEDEPDRRAPLEYRGDPPAIRIVRFWLAAQDASGGRMLGKGATPRELERAMNKATTEVAMRVAKE